MLTAIVIKKLKLVEINKRKMKIKKKNINKKMVRKKNKIMRK
jgi:hypothetical protein